MAESRKYDPFIVKPMPGCDMTVEELERQVTLVSFLADIGEFIPETDEPRRQGE